MRHPQIVVLGYSEAAMLLRKLDPRLLTGIISIHGAREFGVEAPGILRLDLTFDDVDVPQAGDHVAEYHARQTRQARAEMGLKEVPPRKEDARAIIDFARPLASRGGLLLAHCGAGISRSPAAALLCLTVWNDEGRERECVEELLVARACSIPHRGLVRFGDELLGRGGKLLDAVESTHK